PWARWAFPGNAHRAQGRSYAMMVACVVDARSAAHRVSHAGPQVIDAGPKKQGAIGALFSLHHVKQAIGASAPIR
ncbi:hypothetical protein VDF96_07725, partial [Xanthomonas campestris pv. raphani]|uniref:hypothetical protein n=1 Tax=Xanthomonas campestris TaxID=339 RepID=UPI002B2238BB